MKKTVFLMLITTGVVLFVSSCRKDYICECSYTLPGMGATTDDSAELDDQKKKDAEQACSDIEQSWKATDANASCTLK